MTALVLLLVMDVRAIVEFWERFYVHRRLPGVERLTSGGALYWATWALVVLFDIGVLWLTIRIGRRLRLPERSTA